MAICDKVSSAYEFNCQYPEQGGMSEEILVINHADIDRTQGTDGFTYNSLNPLIVEAIHLKEGTKAYSVKGKRNPNTMIDTPTIDGTSTGFVHSVMFPFYEHAPDNAQTLKALMNSKVLVIGKTNQRNATGNNMFKIAGKDVGMYLTEGVYNTAEAHGVRMLTLSNEDGFMEPNPLSFLFITSIAATQALYDSLKIEVPVTP